MSGLKKQENPMKTVALNEVKDDMSKYLRLAENEEVIITRHGKPAGVLIGFANEEDWFDYRLEHDLRPGLARDLGRAIGRVVVADDEFPAAVPVERLRRRPDALERRSEQALLVERRDDDGKLQARCFLKKATVRSQASFAADSL